jgi:GNAT superfamily N-acetyltransferase
MNNGFDNITITLSEFNSIHKFILDYYTANNITVDSFWESEVTGSNFYTIKYKDEIIGYFGIKQKTVLCLFNVFEKYRNRSQKIFETVKRYEEVMQALVPTGDEYFLSLCLDNYVRIEKQAYFSRYVDENKPSEIKNLEFILADVEKDAAILDICHDFLKDIIRDIKEKAEKPEIYIVKDGNEVIGFGVVEYHKIVTGYGSSGMIVREEYRRQGYGANILNGLKGIIKRKGYTAVSGCWYYNHNSLKTMESAGGYSKTRLLRIYF